MTVVGQARVSRGPCWPSLCSVCLCAKDTEAHRGDAQGIGAPEDGRVAPEGQKRTLLPSWTTSTVRCVRDVGGYSCTASCFKPLNRTHKKGKGIFLGGRFEWRRLVTYTKVSDDPVNE